MKDSSMIALCDRADRKARDSGVPHCVVLIDCGDSRRHCVVSADYCDSDDFYAFDGRVIYSSDDSI